MVASDPAAYDRFYNVIANPILWFIQHYLWDLSNAPDIRRAEVEAWEEGYKVVNDDIADCVVRAIEGQEDPVVMLHDYHLYTCPGLIRRGAARRLPPLLRPHPLVPAGLMADPPQPLARGDLPQHARQRHHRLPHDRLLPQLPAVLPRADGARGRLRARGGDPRRPRGLGAGLSRSRSTPSGSTGPRSPRRSPTTRRSCCAAAATT